jgi:hypothetical protein
VSPGQQPVQNQELVPSGPRRGSGWSKTGWAAPLTVAASRQPAEGGGGVEWRWDNHSMLRGEYLFVEFSSLKGVSMPVNGPFFATFNHRATFSKNIGRLFLSYKF